MPKKKTTTNVSLEYQRALNQEPSMNEIDLLAIFIDNFQQYDEHTKKRIIDYLHSRYYSYFGYATINNEL